jgi:hypothetical protein
MASSLNHWRWRVLRAGERIGLPGIAAGMVLVSVAAAWLAFSLPTAHRLAELQDSNAELARRASARAAGPRRAPLSTAEQLTAFESGFAAPHDLSQNYARLWSLARKHGLQLRQADFKYTESGPDAAARYAIVLPLSAEFAPLRGFIADALRDNPALALEEMSVRRADARSTQLDARLRFVLFVHQSD